jgi:hypothetical protein
MVSKKEMQKNNLGGANIFRIKEFYCIAEISLTYTITIIVEIIVIIFNKNIF